jgi:hypothetical protein
MVTVVVSLLVCHITMLGAGSALAPATLPVTATLRTYGLIYAFGFMALLSMTLGGSARMFPMGTGSGPTVDVLISNALLVGFLLFALALPALSTYSWEGTLRQRPDGLFRLRRTMSGHPSGGLPYLWCLSLALIGGVFVGGQSTGVVPGSLFWNMAINQVALWTMWFAGGRLISSLRQNIRTKQILVFTILVFGYIAPPALVASIDPEARYQNLWHVVLLRPLTDLGNTSVQGALLPMAGLYVIVAGLLFVLAERRRAAIVVPSYYQEDL